MISQAVAFDSWLIQDAPQNLPDLTVLPISVSTDRDGTLSPHRSPSKVSLSPVDLSLKFLNLTEFDDFIGTHRRRLCSTLCMGMCISLCMGNFTWNKSKGCMSCQSEIARYSYKRFTAFDKVASACYGAVYFAALVRSRMVSNLSGSAGTDIEVALQFSQGPYFVISIRR